MAARRRVRRAQLADLAELLAIEAEGFPDDAFGRAQLRYLITRARGAVLVVEAAGAVAGAAIVLWRRAGVTARLYSIAVRQRAQRRGLGTVLLRACEREAAAHGCQRLSLEVRANNAGARLFYLRHGYHVAADLPGYYHDGGNGVRMCRALPVAPPMRGPRTPPALGADRRPCPR